MGDMVCLSSIQDHLFDQDIALFLLLLSDAPDVLFGLEVIDRIYNIFLDRLNHNQLISVALMGLLDLLGVQGEVVGARWMLIGEGPRGCLGNVVAQSVYRLLVIEHCLVVLWISEIHVLTHRINIACSSKFASFWGRL